MLVLSGVGIRGTGNEYGTHPVVSDNSAPASKKEAGAHLIPKEQKKTPNSKPNSGNDVKCCFNDLFGSFVYTCFPRQDQIPCQTGFPGTLLTKIPDSEPTEEADLKNDTGS